MDYFLAYLLSIGGGISTGCGLACFLCALAYGFYCAFMAFEKDSPPKFKWPIAVIIALFILANLWPNPDKLIKSYITIQVLRVADGEAVDNAVERVGRMLDLVEKKIDNKPSAPTAD